MNVRIIEPTKSQSTTRKRVCAYARVSSASIAQGESLETQTTYYRERIESHPDYEYIGIFADQGITGTKDDRPELQKMLALAREQKIDLMDFVRIELINGVSDQQLVVDFFCCDAG